MNKLACVLAVLLVGTACSSNAPTGTGPGVDNDASTDVMSSNDTPMASGDATVPPVDSTTPPADRVTPPADTTPPADRVTPPADRAPPPADRVAPADVAPAGDYGACGMATNTALCMCGMNMACQQTALQNALSTNSACATCYTNAIAGCCPSQSMAIQTCAMAAGCMDQACAQRMCASQFTALQTCLNAGQMSDTACQGRFGLCFGSSFPQITCGG